MTGRGLALWVGCLFSHGLLWSVRFALLDGPSLLLTMVAIVAVERGHPLWSSGLVGVNALGRETNVMPCSLSRFHERVANGGGSSSRSGSPRFPH